MTEKKERKVTPTGEAKWAHLHTPKAAFKDENGNAKGSPKYQIDMVFSKDSEEWESWARLVMENLRSLPEQRSKPSPEFPKGEVIKKQSPIKFELDENDQPTGRFYVTFKTSDKFKPGVFDKFGNQIPDTVLIGNGSQVKVSYIENVYPKFGGGINFYLNAVQVLELVEYKSQNATAYGFDIEKSTEPAYVPGDESSHIPF